MILDHIPTLSPSLSIIDLIWSINCRLLCWQLSGHSLILAGYKNNKSCPNCSCFVLLTVLFLRNKTVWLFPPWWFTNVSVSEYVDTDNHFQQRMDNVVQVTREPGMVSISLYIMSLHQKCFEFEFEFHCSKYFPRLVLKPETRRSNGLPDKWAKLHTDMEDRRILDELRNIRRGISKCGMGKNPLKNNE